MIRGGCDLFTTKPIASDRKLFKTIDKHLNQIVKDNHLTQSMGRERQQSINSLMGSSASPPSHIQSHLNAHPQQQPSPGQSPQQLPIRRTSVSSVSSNRDPLSTLVSGHPDGDLSFEGAIDSSPFGPLQNVSTKKTFSYLISILNTTYPDHDFSNLQPTEENFHKIHSAEDFINKFNNIMVSLGKRQDLLNWIWDTINAYMDLIPSKTVGQSSRHNSFSHSKTPRHLLMSPITKDILQALAGCQIFEFQPSDQSIIEDLNYPYQTLWSNYWFIYNKKKKRVTFIYLNAINKLHYSLVSKGRGSFSRNRRQRSPGIGVIGNDLDSDVMEDDEDVYTDNYDDQALVSDDENDDENGDVIGDIEI